jgi:membrane-associated phospholipid phosphatase
MDAWARLQVCAVDLLGSLTFPLDRKENAVSVVHGNVAIATLRRPPLASLLEQTQLVLSWAALRQERAPEILTQIEPQFAYWSSVANLHAAYTPYTIELLLLALKFASSVGQRLKFSLVVPRPIDLSARVQPMIEARGFFAYPSGHATEAFMVARLLELLLDPGRHTASQGAIEELVAQLYRQAERISTNRVVAGVHFPIDTSAGATLGVCLAEYMADRCAGFGWQPRKLDGARASAAASDFSLDSFRSAMFGSSTDMPECQLLGTMRYSGAHVQRFEANSAADHPLRWMWYRAMAEWHRTSYPNG